jgi:hypothetical protein
MLRQTKTRLPHPRTEPDIAHEFLWRGEAADVANRGNEACRHDGVDAGNGQEALDGRILDHLLGDLAVKKLEILGEPVKLVQVSLDGGALVARQVLPSKPTPAQPAKQVGMRARRYKMGLQDSMHLVLDSGPMPNLSFFVRREQWATRQLRIRAHGATGWVAGAASCQTRAHGSTSHRPTH